MKLNGRIKYLRKDILNLTLKDISKKLSISLATFGHYETGHVVVPERTLIQISKEFNVNLEWLKTGQGDIFNNFEDNNLLQISKDYNLSKIDKSILKSWFMLNDDEKQAFVKFMENFVGEHDR